MKVSVILSLSFLLVGEGLTRAADDVSSQFDAANRLYAAGHFAEAAAAYQSMIQTHGVSPALLFNLGNAHFKSGHTGQAIGAFRRAAALTPRDPDVRANLQFARSQVQRPTLRPTWWEQSLTKLSLREWTWLTALAFWVTLGLLTVRQIRPAWVAGLRAWTRLAAVITLLLALALTARLTGPAAAEVAIVVTADAAVRNSPFEESPAAFTANDGAELQVRDRKDDWLQVTDGGRRLGWLKATNAVVIPGRA